MQYFSKKKNNLISTTLIVIVCLFPFENILSGLEVSYDFSNRELYTRFGVIWQEVY